MTTIPDPNVSHAATTVGILLFDEVEELDFVGPWEVFAAAGTMDPSIRAVTVSERAGELRCAKGLHVRAAHTLAEAPPIDVLVVPGGRGARLSLTNEPLVAWIRTVAARARWVTSVCTGSVLLHGAGVARGKKVTTHWSFVEPLRARGDVTVVEGVRYVRDGNLVTAAGVSAGIDMSLYLLGELRTPAFAREVQKYIEYFPEPPYRA